MAVRLVSGSPVEAEVYAGIPEVRQVIDRVGSMIMDLHDEEIDLDILYVINNPENPRDFTLAFSGSTMSLEITEQSIDVCDFNDGDEIVLKSFAPDNINGATTWLVNKLEQID